MKIHISNVTILKKYILAHINNLYTTPPTIPREELIFGSGTLFS